MVGYSSDNANIQFHNAMSWVKVGLKGTGTVTSVKLSNVEGNESSSLSGTLEVTIDESGNVIYSANGSNSNFVVYLLNKFFVKMYICRTKILYHEKAFIVFCLLVVR